MNNKPVAGAISIPFSNCCLVDDDGEEVGLMVLHRIVKVSTGTLVGRSGGLMVSYWHLYR